MAEAERPQPPQPPSPLDVLRDRRAVVDTGLGPVAFVTANAIWDLETAAYVAIGLSVVVAAYRLMRREPLTNAIGGILGTGLCVFIALRTGDASGYFIPRMLQNAAHGARLRRLGAVQAPGHRLHRRRAVPRVPERLVSRRADPAPVRRGDARVRGPVRRCGRSSTRS